MFRLLTLLLLLSASCETIDLYERVEPVPGHAWNASFQPTFTFDIQDTTAPYQLYFIFRHSNRYGYNNIWFRLHRTEPNGRTSVVPYEVRLATNERGWLGTGMDDLYEHRSLLPPPPGDSLRIRRGTYTFRLEQIMRENPLQEVWSAGIRLEKKEAQ